MTAWWKKMIVMKISPVIRQSVQDKISQIRGNPLAAKRLWPKLKLRKKRQKNLYLKKIVYDMEIRV